MHGLLLVHNDALSGVENLLHLGHDVPDAFLSVMSEDKVVNHSAIDWARPVKRVQRRKIFNTSGLKLSTDFLHSGRFKLKNRVCTPLGKQLHSLRIVKRYLFPGHLVAMRPLYAT